MDIPKYIVELANDDPERIEDLLVDDGYFNLLAIYWLIRKDYDKIKEISYEGEENGKDIIQIKYTNKKIIDEVIANINSAIEDSENLNEIELVQSRSVLTIKIDRPELEG